MHNGFKVREEKRALRKKYSSLRQAIRTKNGEELSSAICRNFTSSMAYRHSDTVLLYYSINSEVITQSLIDEILASDKRLALPVCRENGEMIFKYVESRDDLTKGLFSALEPKNECENFDGAKHTVCVIPAIAFDKAGYRIGYGKGYYDRYLTDPSIVKIGFIYDELLVDKLPRGRFDLSCDLVITEKGVFNTGEK